PDESGINKWARKRVIDEVVARRIFINTATKGTINARVRIIMPGLSRFKSLKINLVFTRSAIIACFAWRLLEIAARAIVKQKQLVARHRHCMLSYRRQGSRW